MSITFAELGKEFKTKEEPEVFTFDSDFKPEKSDWLIDPLWQARTIGLFTGDGGLGKTHFALQLAHAFITGTEIPNTPFAVTKPRPVVYISQEDEASFIWYEFRNQFPDIMLIPECFRQIDEVPTPAVFGGAQHVRKSPAVADTRKAA